MTEYDVRWIIQKDAETPIEAAFKALTTQRDPESIATVFRVRPRDGSGPEVEVDFDPHESGIDGPEPSVTEVINPYQIIYVVRLGDPSEDVAAFEREEDAEAFRDTYADGECSDVGRVTLCDLKLAAELIASRADDDDYIPELDNPRYPLTNPMEES